MCTNSVHKYFFTCIPIDFKHEMFSFKCGHNHSKFNNNK